MWQVIHTTELMRHRMHMTKTGIIERHPRQILRIGHPITRFEIIATRHSNSQITRNQTNRL